MECIMKYVVSRFALALIASSSCHATLYVKGSTSINFSDWMNNLSNVESNTDNWINGKRQSSLGVALGSMVQRDQSSLPAYLFSEIGYQKISKVSAIIDSTASGRLNIQTKIFYAGAGITQSFSSYRTAFMLGFANRSFDIANETILTNNNWSLERTNSAFMRVSFERSIIPNSHIGLSYSMIPGRSFKIADNTSSRLFIPNIHQAQLALSYEI